MMSAMDFYATRPDWAESIRLSDPIDGDELVRLYLEHRHPEQKHRAPEVWTRMMVRPSPPFLDPAWWSWFEQDVDDVLATLSDRT